MIKMEQVIKWMSDVRNMIDDTNISLNNLKAFNRNYSSEVEQVKNDPFFKHYAYQLKFVAIVQLAKLFQDSKKTQKRNLIKLCNYVKDKKYNDTFRAQLRNNKKKVESDKLDIPENFQNERNYLLTCRLEIKREMIHILKEINSKSNIIDKIVNARHQIYAHTDPGANAEIISIEDMESLVTLANEVYNRINTKIIDKPHSFLEITVPYSVERILSRMIETEKK